MAVQPNNFRLKFLYFMLASPDITPFVKQDISWSTAPQEDKWS